MKTSLLLKTALAGLLTFGTLGLPAADTPDTPAEPLLKDGARVLFIGNSYTFFHGGLPRHLKAACAAAQEPLRIEAEMVTAGGKELSYLYESTDAVAKIRNGKWDVVILQGGFNAPVLDDQHEQFKDSIRKFHAVITESGAKPVIWAVWEQKGHKIPWNTWQKILTVTKEAADPLNMPVIPVGSVWAQIRRNGIEGMDVDGETFLYQDFVHPTKQAFHMNTLIHYAFLTGKSCIGLDYKDTNGEFADPALEDAVQKTIMGVLQPKP